MSSNSSKQNRLVLMELLHVFQKNRNRIFLLTFLVLVTVALNHFFSVPIFRSSATVAVKWEKETSFDEVLLRTDAFTNPVENRDLSPFFEIAKSQKYFDRVAKVISSNEAYDSVNVLDPNSLSLFSPRYWQAYVRRWRASDTGGESSRKPRTHAEVKSALQAALSVGEDREQRINIQVHGVDSNSTEVIANIAANQLVDLIVEDGMNEMADLEKNLSKWLSDAQAKLDAKVDALAKITQKYEIVEGGKEAYSNRLFTLDRDLDEAKLTEGQLQREIEQIEARLRQFDVSVLQKSFHASDSISEQQANVLRDRITELDKQKKLLISQGYSESDWRMVDIKNQLEQNAHRLKEILPSAKFKNADDGLSPRDLRVKLTELRERKKSANTKIVSLTRSRADVTLQMNKYPTADQEVTTAKMAVDLAQREIQSLYEKVYQLDVKKIGVRNRAHIVQSAAPGTRAPTASLLVKVLFFGLGSLVGLTLFFLGLRTIDQRISGAADFELMKLPVIAQIPEVMSPNRGPVRSKLVCKFEPECIESLAFRFLRIRLENVLNKGPGMNSLLITSPGDDDGKSFVVSNFAISAGSSDKRVIIVDCDLQRPAQGAIWGHPNQVGLLELLSMESFLDDVILMDVAKNVDLICVGKGDLTGSDALESKQFSQLIEYLQRSYDLVLLDFPSVARFPEGGLVADLVDAALVVGRVDQTSSEGLRSALETYSKLTEEGRIFGIVNYSKELVDQAIRMKFTGHVLRKKQDQFKILKSGKSAKRVTQKSNTTTPPNG